MSIAHRCDPMNMCAQCSKEHNDLVEWAKNEGRKKLANNLPNKTSDYFTEHDDGKGVRLYCFDKEYNFGKKLLNKCPGS